MKKLALAALAASAISFPALAGEAYVVDEQHAWVSFKTNHAGWSNAHGTFNTVSGNIDFDKEDVTNSSISITIDAASIDTNLEQRDGDLMSPDFLNADEFPEITFESTSVEKTGEKTGKVTGDLTLAGVTKPVTLDVTWNAESPLPWDASTMKTGFSATGSFDVVEEFGIQKIADFGLGPVIYLDIDIEAIKQ